ncbi:hypothetical protein BJY00DRAFT_309831 [Aspergillus carlsbadensis]|nr:hypothetical protein BJY00DRAFT_309831 [Aspergillus carlsbadensis]
MFQPLSERDKHILSLYGRVPSGGGGMLGPHAKERVYFDSGDYALSAAKRETDSGAIHTGTSHPVRGSISHPFAPIPNTSNVGSGADEGVYAHAHGHGVKGYPGASPGAEIVSSPLSRGEKLEGGYFGEGAEQIE